jgi:hypothetical protein
MDWNLEVKERLRVLFSKMPIFHRRVAEEAVTRKAEENARLRNAASVEEEDVVSAFFVDVPSPFYSMMIRLLEQTGFDYKKYGFPKGSNNSSRK